MIKSCCHRFVTGLQDGLITEQFLHKGARFFLDHILQLLLCFIFQNLFCHRRNVNLASGARFLAQIAVAVDRPVDACVTLIDDSLGADLHDVVINLAFQSEAVVEGI